MKESHPSPKESVLKKGGNTFFVALPQQNINGPGMQI
jgi:hypothetical protein